jgi:hypothetical protein
MACIESGRRGAAWGCERAKARSPAQVETGDLKGAQPEVPRGRPSDKQAANVHYRTGIPPIPIRSLALRTAVVARDKLLTVVRWVLAILLAAVVIAWLVALIAQ